MKSLRYPAHNGCIGGRFTNSTRIESFWRKHNTNVKDYFLEQFKNLEWLENFKTTIFFYIWLSHFACMKAINQKIQAIMRMHKNNPLLNEVNKSPLQLHQCSILKHQFVETIIDLDALHYLNE